MDGWIRLGELAKQLKTSCGKVGQMASVLQCEKIKKNTGTTTHLYIRQTDAEIIKDNMGTFTAVLGRGAEQKPVKPKKISKKKKEDDRVKFEQLFVNPIIVQGFGTGITRGQGLEAYWGKMEGSK